MCKSIEDMMKKAEKEGEQKAELRIKQETAKRMILMGRLTYEEVAEYAGLALEEIQEMVKGMAMCIE